MQIFVADVLSFMIGRAVTRAEFNQKYLACGNQFHFVMKDILYDEIPSLDLADFYKGDDQAKQKFVNALGEAYHNIGFVAIRNHFLSDAMQQNLYSAIKKFFALPDEVKKKYERSDLAGQRGYIGKG